MIFLRAIFCLFKDLLGGIPRDRNPEEKADQEHWAIFNHPFLQAQEQSIPHGEKIKQRGLKIFMDNQGASRKSQL